MADPFAIDGPAVVSFSGGRTSAYMVRRILDAGLRPDVHVMFANTGKEREETLDFVHEIETRWSVKIWWLEYYRRHLPIYRSQERAMAAAAARKAVGRDYQRPLGPGDRESGYRIVNYKTASRNGEPFENVIDLFGLPNVTTRLCTKEMKIGVLKKAMRDLGYDAWTNVVGIRADEPRRIARMRAPTGQLWDNELPLADAGVTKPDVLAFWRTQPFDLALPVDPLTGDTIDGNCDLCFLKGVKKRRLIASRQPERVKWWAWQELRTGQLFRDQKDNYVKLTEPDLLTPLDGACALGEDDLGDCVCHD